MLDKIRLFLMALLLVSVSFAMSGEAQDFEGTFLCSSTLPYGVPPFRYEGSRFISITFKTSPEVIRSLVPPPLVADSNNIMSILIGLQKIVEPMPVSYYEAFISIPVSYADTEGNYLPVLYLDKALPIVGGREIWGFRKVDAEIYFEAENGKIHAGVKREGATLIDAIVSIGEPVTLPKNSSNKPIFNLKLIPSVKKDAPPDVKQLTTVTTTGNKVTELRSGEAKLVFGSTPLSPLGAIPILKIVACAYTESGFVLDYGEVVYDYLAKAKEKSSSSRKKK